MAQTKADLLDENARLNQALIEEVEARQQLEKRIVDEALRLAKANGWCQVVQRGLRRMGLGHQLPHYFRVRIGRRRWNSETHSYDQTNGWVTQDVDYETVKVAKRRTGWTRQTRAGYRMQVVEYDGNGQRVGIVEKNY